MSNPEHQSFDPREFRNACGRFATGITIVTAEVDGADGCEVRGMTANAFMSVSLEPPLIAVSVDNRASIKYAIAKSGRYAVSILRHDQEAFSTHFAGRPDDALDVEFVRHDDHPVLAVNIAYMVTTIYAIYPCGDHTLYVGHVDEFAYRDEDPILYYAGQYRQL